MYTPFQKTHYENQKLWTLSLPLPFSGRRNVTIPINGLLIGIVLFDQAIKEGQHILWISDKNHQSLFLCSNICSFSFPCTRACFADEICCLFLSPRQNICSTSQSSFIRVVGHLPFHIMKQD